MRRWWSCPYRTQASLIHVIRWLCCKIKKKRPFHLSCNISIAEHSRTKLTSEKSPYWRRNRSFSPLLLETAYLNCLKFGLGPFLPFSNHFLYPAPPFSCVRSSPIRDQPLTRPLNFYFRNVPNWITYICKGKETHKGGYVCLCAWEESYIVFDLILCFLCGCVCMYVC